MTRMVWTFSREAYETGAAEARILELIGKAKPMFPPLKEPPDHSELGRWRASYLAATGEQPDKRWGVARLRQELEAGE